MSKPIPGTITSTQVREMLRAAADRLSAREEKALRMREGASLEQGAALPRRGQSNLEARAELLAMEIELKRKLATRGETASPAPVRTKEKEKIIRALRRLK